MKRAWIVLLPVCMVWGAMGQHPKENFVNPNTPKVTARFIPDSIAIGDHFLLRIEVTKDIMQQVGFPEMDSSGMLTDNIEILEEKPFDTVKLDNRRVTIGKEYLLTTFQAGKFFIKGIPVLYVDKNIVDTLHATPDSILIEVGTFEIDTTTQTIYDIKPAMKAPLRLGEFSGYVIIGIILLLLIAVSIYLFLMWRSKKGLFKRNPNEPAHVTAIRALEALSHQKLWQNNKHKLYYTLLTNIIRIYIEGRYSIQAMEMTTEELLDALKGSDIPPKNLTQLASMLSTADLAKFAKYAPPAEDNESSYNDAYYFVEYTKPTEVESQTEEIKR